MGNPLGFDTNSWALGFDGMIYFDGDCDKYSPPLNETSIISVKIWKSAGQLKFVANGVDFGVAF